MIIDDGCLTTWTVDGVAAPWTAIVRLSMISGISPLRERVLVRQTGSVHVHVFAVWVHGGPEEGFTCCSERTSNEPLEEQKVRMEFLHREVMRSMVSA